MQQKTRIGFIGFGNMAGSMARGLVEQGGYDSSLIWAKAGDFEKLKKRADLLGIHPVQSVEELIQNVDLVIVAVKPYMVEGVLMPVLEELQGKPVVSVAAGLGFDAYEEILKPGTHHLSTIPNVPIAQGEGIIVCEDRHSLTEEEWQMFAEIFSPVALIESVDSAHLSIAGTVAGCSPAFTAMYIEALGDAGVKHGLTRPVAYRLAAQMICGTGKMYLETGMHPGAIKDLVCSPGGTTIRGVASLEKTGFRGAVMEAIDEIED